MPEYLALSIFVEKVPTRMHPIPGVDTATGLNWRAVMTMQAKGMSAATYLRVLAQRLHVAVCTVTSNADGQATWTHASLVLSQLLDAEWRSGRLLGQRSAQAYFVRCDRTTMTAADMAAGTLVAMVGVAPIKPAEFVILRVCRTPRHTLGVILGR